MLVPNVQGLQRALRAGVREVAVFVSATEGFSRANIGCSVEVGLQRAGDVARSATEKGLAVRAYVSCIFADPFEGPTKKEDVLRAVRALLAMGCYEVSLGDTLGVGTPSDVRGLIKYLAANGVSLEGLAGHFHDTYGQAVANVWEAYQYGLRAFDGSVGGLGGCPFAPGAKGNVATEDIVYMFEQAGIHTGVDLAQLVGIGSWISSQLKKTNDSRAGTALSAKKHKTSHQKSTKPPAKLCWTLTRETPGLKILQSGVNTKVILTRPQNGNALTTAMITSLAAFFEHAAQNTDTLRRIAIVGTGKFFCTGMDLGKNTSPVATTKAESDAQYERLTGLFSLIDQAPQVTVACINGPAFGGGVGLALACDVRIAVRNASITLSEVKLGLCPATISKYVIRELGFAVAREAMLSARAVGADELERLGVVARVVKEGEGHPELGMALDAYLVSLRQCAPEASSMVKKLVEFGWRSAGGENQERGVRELFERMMKGDGEAKMGMEGFRTAKGVEWDEIGVKEQSVRAKL